MGKQSARMCFGGQDHSDIYFENEYGLIHNHCKMYKGNRLLWKREKPKFMFAGYFGFMATSDCLKTFSSFPYPQSNVAQLEKNEPVVQTLGLEYAFGKYFTIQQIAERLYEENTWNTIGFYLLYSEDGYEWKVLRKNKDYAAGYRLGKINKNTKNEKIIFIDDGKTYQINSELKIEVLYEDKMTVLASGNGIEFVIFDGDDYIHILKDGEFQKTPNRKQEITIKYNIEDGFFYFFIYTNNSDSFMDDIALNKTKDGIEFEYLGKVIATDVSNRIYANDLLVRNAFFLHPYIYILISFEKTLNAQPTFGFIRFDANGYSIRELGTWTSNRHTIFNYCIEKMLYFVQYDYEGDNYEIEKNIKYCRIPIEKAYASTFNSLVSQGEELKFTDRIYNWYYEYYGHPTLQYVVCTDENVIIQK